MTLTHAHKSLWVMWLRNLLQEMGYPHLVANPTLMLGDNIQADRWAHLHDMLRGAAPLPEIPVSPYTLSRHGGSSVYRTDPEHVRRRNRELAIVPKEMSSQDEKSGAKHQGV